MRKKITFLFFMFSFFLAFPQDGTLDPTFNTGTTLSNVSSLAETAIYSNNDVICVGKFKVNGVDHTIAKFNSAGALVTSYPLTDVFSGSILGAVRSVVIQPDNKIVISGVFNKYGSITNFSNGNAIRGLIRINTDGTLDQTFAPDLSFLAPIATGTTLSSGKILLNPAGDVYVFYPIPTQANGNYSNFSILKISSTGVVDTAFKNNAPVLI
jgi:hypothetical protein